MSNSLFAISPLDGRYSGRVDELRLFVSEFGLIKYRVIIEVEWLKVLLSGVLPSIDKLDNESNNFLNSICENFSEQSASEIKKIEQQVNHDVKAVEIWLRQHLANDEFLKTHLELIHFGCTSDDINNLAYAMTLRDVREEVIAGVLVNISETLQKMASNYSDEALLSQTHGQPASPTTLGKEMAVYINRLDHAVKQLKLVSIKAKFNGATGGYSAANFAYPDVDWPDISKNFVESFDLEFNPITTQIDPHDYIAEYSDSLARINTILIDLSRDIWLYISRGVFKLATKDGEVGSSTMPHKVNPIDFENAEGNLAVANALLCHLSSVLPISRLQRDLTDSTSLRVIGTALGHSLVAYTSLQKGLNKLEPDHEYISEELNNNWAVLTESVQTVMRKHNIADAYDEIKKLSRGKQIGQQEYLEIVRGLNVPDDDKQRLLELTPATYVGLSSSIANSVSKTSEL